MHHHNYDDQNWLNQYSHKNKIGYHVCMQHFVFFIFEKSVISLEQSCCNSQSKAYIFDFCKMYDHQNKSKDSIVVVFFWCYIDVLGAMMSKCWFSFLQNTSNSLQYVNAFSFSALDNVQNVNIWYAVLQPV